MAGKVFVAITENHDNYHDFHGVFSTGKRAKAIFAEATESDWERLTHPDGTWCWISRGAFADFVVFKTKIDQVIGYVS